jgi:hypothetical protein
MYLYLLIKNSRQIMLVREKKVIIWGNKFKLPSKHIFDFNDFHQNNAFTINLLFLVNSTVLEMSKSNCQLSNKIFYLIENNSFLDRYGQGKFGLCGRGWFECGIVIAVKKGQKIRWKILLMRLFTSSTHLIRRYKKYCNSYPIHKILPELQIRIRVAISP